MKFLKSLDVKKHTCNLVNFFPFGASYLKRLLCELVLHIAFSDSHLTTCIYLLQLVAFGSLINLATILYINLFRVCSYLKLYSSHQISMFLCILPFFQLIFFIFAGSCNDCFPSICILRAASSLWHSQSQKIRPKRKTGYRHRLSQQLVEYVAVL